MTAAAAADACQLLRQAEGLKLANEVGAECGDFLGQVMRLRNGCVRGSADEEEITQLAVAASHPASAGQ